MTDVKARLLFPVSLGLIVQQVRLLLNPTPHLLQILGTQRRNSHAHPSIKIALQNNHLIVALKYSGRNPLFQPPLSWDLALSAKISQ